MLGVRTIVYPPILIKTRLQVQKVPYFQKLDAAIEILIELYRGRHSILEHLTPSKKYGNLKACGVRCFYLSSIDHLNVFPAQDFTRDISQQPSGSCLHSLHT